MPQRPVGGSCRSARSGGLYSPRRIGEEMLKAGNLRCEAAGKPTCSNGERARTRTAPVCVLIHFRLFEFRENICRTSVVKKAARPSSAPGPGWRVRNRSEITTNPARSHRRRSDATDKLAIGGALRPGFAFVFSLVGCQNIRCAAFLLVAGLRWSLPLFNAIGNKVSTFQQRSLWLRVNPPPRRCDRS